MLLLFTCIVSLSALYVICGRDRVDVEERTLRAMDRGADGRRAAARWLDKIGWFISDGDPWAPVKGLTKLACMGWPPLADGVRLRLPRRATESVDARRENTDVSPSAPAADDAVSLRRTEGRRETRLLEDRIGDSYAGR